MDASIFLYVFYICQCISSGFDMTKKKSRWVKVKKYHFNCTLYTWSCERTSSCRDKDGKRWVRVELELELELELKTEQEGGRGRAGERTLNLYSISCLHLLALALALINDLIAFSKLGPNASRVSRSCMRSSRVLLRVLISTDCTCYYCITALHCTALYGIHHNPSP